MALDGQIMDTWRYPHDLGTVGKPYKWRLRHSEISSSTRFRLVEMHKIRHEVTLSQVSNLSKDPIIITSPI